MEKKQTAIEWLFEKITQNKDIGWRGTQYQDLFQQALAMENKINQQYYKEGAQDCKKAFEKTISDVAGNINNI